MDDKKRPRQYGPPDVDEQIDDFLRLQSILESNQGQNLNHKPLPTGEVAVGQYGLLPRTVREMATRTNQAKPNPVDAAVKIANDKKITNLLKASPEAEDRYARKLAEHLLNTTGGDEKLMATGWLYGHNRAPANMEKKLNNDPEYDARIEDAQKRANKQIIAEEQEDFNPYTKLKTLMLGKP